MLRLALSRGHGSTICVTTLVATALPPVAAIGSRRSKYSEQPPTATSSPASARVRMALLNDCIGLSLRHFEHVSGERPVTPDGDACRRRRELARFFLCDFGLSEQEEVDVIRLHRVVGRRLEHVAGPSRTHETRSDDDGEVRLILLIGLA